MAQVPVKSLCRAKRVSRRRRGLISHPDHRGRLSQTLAGFIHSTSNGSWRFTNLWEAQRPALVCCPFSFMPGYEDVTIVDSCNGLLLCRASKAELSSPGALATPCCHVVCNPATRTWHVLPDSISGCFDSYNELRPARLGFDPTVSPHFHVFEFVSNEDGDWEEETHIFKGSLSVFFNGVLHLVTIDFTVVAVNVEVESWWVVLLPDDELQNWDCYEAWDPCFLGRYKGNLCYINECYFDTDIAIWFLEDYAADEWVLKHRVSIQLMTENIATPARSGCYNLITIHPHCNWILYVTGCDKTLMAYDMERDEVHVIQNLGSGCILPCIPYVPFYGSH
ncbi:hypothetical protein PAHAL_7G096800 [Panicum hallii]|uniref:F-box associated beta-propeller type 3 domain-containing protein n=1 Tax=Panicum hallii TaxID=206008 RepID=A0A2T8IBK7_9POAL|nr:hypothetical protein PAHAL_7G096800 [Panicum hallii]